MLSNNKIYVDTSAFYALIDRSDRYHEQASILWPKLLNDNITLVTSNYVVWETLGLLQKKIGFEAASLWYRDILGVLDIWWVNADIHQRACELWMNLGRNRPSLVDCVSFVTMHQHDIEKAFCFKPHFTDHGFRLLTPAAAESKERGESEGRDAGEQKPEIENRKIKR
jgi:predicted nucleic acid-binding protein